MLVLCNVTIISRRTEKPKKALLDIDARNAELVKQTKDQGLFYLKI